MRRDCKLGIAIFAALAVLGFGARLYAQMSHSGLHPLNESCGGCHLAGDNTTADNARTLVASQEQLCGRCHANALQISHPSGFTPRHGKAIPAAYPLDWKGDLTCSTCHEVHSDLPGKLRGTAAGRDMCLACHEQSFFDKMRDGGVSLLQSGHMLGTPNSQNWQHMDPYSLQCMECHAERGDVDIDSNQILRHGSQNHPIGRSYAEAERRGIAAASRGNAAASRGNAAASRGRGRSGVVAGAVAVIHNSYKPASMLPKSILLPNGMVSCVSCHEGYTKNHGKVVNTNRGNSLCLECHDL